MSIYFQGKTVQSQGTVMVTDKLHAGPGKSGKDGPGPRESQFITLGFQGSLGKMVQGPGTDG